MRKIIWEEMRDGTIEFSVICFLQKRFFNLFALHFLIYFSQFHTTFMKAVIGNIPLISKLIIVLLVNKMYSCDINLMMSNSEAAGLF